MIGSDMSVGVSVFGNGGMNSKYGPIPVFNSGVPNTGIDLVQLFISPTIAKKINENHSVGASLNFAYQRFEAYGIGNFAGATPSGTADFLSDVGFDDSFGVGIRLGWTGKLSPTVTMGATYQSRTRMSKFDKYRELFAEQGDFDIPENFGVGLAIQANPNTTIALDLVRINYGDVKSVSNPISLLANGLGCANCAGFGWDDQTVFKIGVSHNVSDNLTVRAGYNHGSGVIPNTEVAFNILAPATVENHLTLGATWKLKSGAELSGYYMHAFSNSISGATPQLGGPGINSTIKMNQNAIGIAYGWKM
jgi:long-chain fatty acid transport protein